MIDNQTLDQKIDIPTDFLRIHSRTFSKVRRNSFLRVFSMKTNTPFVIMQHRREEVEIRLYQQYHLTLIVSLFIYDFNDRNSFVIFGFSLVFIYTSLTNNFSRRNTYDFIVVIIFSVVISQQI